ncbi:unnamed protein product [Caenorhabditis brenneri]
MSFSTWISNQIFSIYDSDRIFEEMDRMILEGKMIESQELQEGSTWNLKWILTSSVIAAGGISIAFLKSEKVSFQNWNTFAIGAGLVTVVGSTVSLGGHFWFRRKVKSTRRIIHQLDRTRVALKKRKQVFFSISMRIPRHRHPLILRACRLTVSAIECLVEKTKLLNDGSTWQDLYTDAIREITMRSSENSEVLKIEEIGDENEDEMDFEAVFEALISVFKLHASEYCRVVVIDFLNSIKLDFEKLKSFLKTCNELQEFTSHLKSIERSALKSETENLKNSKKQESKYRSTIEMEIGWKQQTAMALESILESLQSESVKRSEVELALHKTLVMVGTEKIDSKSESLPKIEPKNDSQTETIIIEKEKERTDVDMVFEGVPLSEEEKTDSKSVAARDVLLDGSESRKHGASLFGELQMVLEPRRNDFAKRERAALAKFYGVDENQLAKEEEDSKKEETFEGIGAGGDEEPEPYDWRKDAETSAGIHHDADNDAFLKALNLRRVDDDIIE